MRLYMEFQSTESTVCALNQTIIDFQNSYINTRKKKKKKSNHSSTQELGNKHSIQVIVIILRSFQVFQKRKTKQSGSC